MVSRIERGGRENGKKIEPYRKVSEVGNRREAGEYTCMF